jgi:hypothetical protein
MAEGRALPPLKRLRLPDAAALFLSGKTMAKMEHLMNMIHCDTAICQGNGNDQKEIRVWYVKGPPQKHSIECPYCGNVILRKLPAAKILKITTPQQRVGRLKPI